MTFHAECRIEWFYPSNRQRILYVYIGDTCLYLAEVFNRYRCRDGTPYYQWTVDEDRIGDVDTLTEAVNAIRETLNWQYEIPPLEE